MLRAQRSKEYTFKRIISDFQAFILKNLKFMRLFIIIIIFINKLHVRTSEY
jgi:hypothetical protein